MQKRRNISFGGGGSNNYIEPRPSIIDLENSVGAPNRVSRPTINNTYDGIQQPKNNTSTVTPQNKFNMNVIRSNESAFSNRDSRDYQGQPLNGSMGRHNQKKNPDLMSQKYNNSEQQNSRKYPNYIEELLLNSQQQFSYDNNTSKAPTQSNQRNRQSRDHSINKSGAQQVQQYTNTPLVNQSKDNYQYNGSS